MGLCQEQIQETASAAGRALDQLEIFGAEDDHSQGSQVIDEAADGLTIQAQFPLGGGPVHFDVAFAGGDDLAADEVGLLGMADHLSAAHATEGAQCGQEVDRLQNVGFALRIVSQQHLEAGSEVHVQPGVVAKIAQAQVS